MNNCHPSTQLARRIPPLTRNAQCLDRRNKELSLRHLVRFCTIPFYRSFNLAHHSTK